MNIVFIGMRGAGKTAVGRILAGNLGWPFLDMDNLIEQRAGMNITNIVREKGWEQFRQLEEVVSAEAGERENNIIAAGGGVVTRPQNVQALKKHGIIVWLQASAGTLLERLGDGSGRPMLVNGRTWREDIEFTLAERQPLYEAAADISVDTESSSPEAVAAALIMLLKERGVIND